MFETHNSEVLQVVCEHNPLAIAVFDMDMKYLFASDLWYEHYGIDESDIIGKSHYEIFPEILDKPDWMEVHARTLKGDSFLQPHDPFIREDGTTQYIRWAMKPWFHSDTGSQGGVVLYSEDVTDQRELELEKERLVAELKKEIALKEKYEQELIEQAIKDPLTGLFNRRYFESVCADEIKKSDRYDTDLSFMLFDIDFFKNVNDTHGHDAGDNVLVLLTSILTETARETDICARWGGEEFIVLMPSTSLPSAEKLAERLREKIDTNHFPKVEHITISIGVSSYRSGKEIDQCIKEADKALYLAKESGRNMVSVYS
ncbi:GGDEF domain-containing protein [Neptuniibacter sp.]|uniref:sensor domain-containing diguanylate cyclase n=1 Tax=Neptuniibacter sp. TaxID=1962643 RepID=UPI00262ACE8E|nr:GGDEF domain-containing protein [Neptuniibacter sp.]MCP4598481.1 GGDEF domain-containing protein [Neptuniibacter sp.]